MSRRGFGDLCDTGTLEVDKGGKIFSPLFKNFYFFNAVVKVLPCFDGFSEVFRFQYNPFFSFNEKFCFWKIERYLFDT